MNKPNQIWQRAGKDLLDSLQSGPQGLTTKEAQQRLEKYGPNELQEGGKKSGFRIFLEQFADFLVIILIVAAVISAVLGDVESMVVILAVITMNAILGTVQTIKAEASLDSLKQMSAPTAKVVRDGKTIQIPGRDVVPGDIVVLEAGDAVCADGRLLESASLKTAESALTGESLPVEKEETPIEAEDVPLGDRKNMVFSGTFVTYGRGRFLVTGTGMETEMGKIASLLKTTSEKKTPLQVSLDNFGKKLSIGILVLCAILFAVSVLVRGENVMSAFLFAVALAVAAIPEALSSIVTIVLSFGTRKMAKEHAIIRKLQAVEGLGSVSVICSDKTGTLTQNRMTLVKAYLDETGEVEDISENNSPAVRQLLDYGTLCCDGTVTFEDGQEHHIGDPTETAIVLAAHKNGSPQEQLNQQYPRLAQIPFDSDRKLMTSINRIDGKNIVIVKGAFDMMLSRCIKGNFEKAHQINDEMSSNALRVLAIGYREIDRIPQKLTSEEIENGLTLMGLVGMIDPPRPEAKAAVATCREAGIRPVMITGDHVVTASAIAKDLGILKEGDLAITGAQLDAMSEEELAQNVDKISVYARVSPENKIRIVRAWQDKGQVVSMTGDGVNDAPALKAADIGCAMGITGTDVAKGAADMTLTDDNFATIVDAVREGRGIYSNIRKVVGFLLGTNIGEVLTVFTAMLLWHKTPLLSMQLLWINLVTDSLPAIALGMEAVESDIMQHKPKSKDEGLFAHGLGLRVVLQGMMFALLTLSSFWMGQNMVGTLAAGQTMAFITLSISQLVQSYNMRSERSLFHIGPFSNKKLNQACLASLALVLLVLFTPLRIAFGLAALPAKMYLIAFGLSFVPLLVMEFSKKFGLIKHQH